MNLAEYRSAAAQPKRKRRAAPEHALQAQVVRFFEAALRAPTVWTGLDAGAGKMTKAAAGMRKARGVKAGWPDLLVMHPAPEGKGTLVVGIELKAPKGSISIAQAEMLNAFFKAGAWYVTAKSLDAVVKALEFCKVPLHARPS